MGVHFGFLIAFVFFGPFTVNTEGAVVPDTDIGWEITEEDTILIKKKEGLWMYDDDGKYVRIKYEPSQKKDMMNISQSVKNRVVFSLYTRKARNQALYVNDIKTLRNSHFNPEHETKIITHGWMNSIRSKACSLLIDAYLEHGDYNVIVVDWSKITKSFYTWACAHVKRVGMFVSTMIDFLESQGMDMNTTTLVGHSLGAHVMGIAGYYAASTASYLVGLDPALPFFSRATVGNRISKKDAKHVEIIHTNAGLLGYRKEIGHSDYYPNGGKKQLGCPVDPAGACSHCRAYEFFAESILNDNGFYGRKCKKTKTISDKTCNGEYGLMGGHGPSNEGSFYLKTRNSSPFALGNYF